MLNVVNVLDNKKTYILTALGALATIFGFSATVGVAGLVPLLIDFLTSPEMKELLGYGAVAALRAGVAKS